jgi:hypothetical protein
MKQTIFVVIIFSLFTSRLLTQDLDITGAGARAEGMGGAFIGVADDASALMWNPAGLSQLERPEASIVSRMLIDHYNLSAPSYPSGINMDHTHFVINFGSLVLPIRIGSTDLVVAVAYQRPLDFNTGMAPYDESMHGTGGVSTITPGIGLQIGSVVSIGGAVNIWTGENEFSVVNYQETNISSQRWTYKGVNIVAGGLIDLNGLSNPLPVKIGVCIRTPFDLKANGMIGYGDAVGYPAQPWGYPLDRKIQMPVMHGIGTSVCPIKDLTIAVDYEMRPYGGREIQVGLDGIWDSGYTMSEYDLNEYRIGAQYMIDAKDCIVPLRLGYRSHPTVYTNFNAQGNDMGQATGGCVSFGSGLIFKHVGIDAAYTMAEYTIHQGSTAMKYTTGTFIASVIVYL